MPDQPNVLCISIDSLRADFASFITADTNTTPFLESFADEAAIYTRAISPSIWTLPVHASIFTGLYPDEHDIQRSDRELGDHPTFAKRFRSEGYATAAFHHSAWFETADIIRGFESHNLLRKEGGDGADQKDSNPLARIGSIGKAIEAISPKLREIATSLSNHFDRTYLGYDDDSQTIERAKDWHAAVDEPFCSFVHLKDVHWPYRTDIDAVRRFTDRGHLSLLWNRVYWQRKVYQNPHSRWTGEIELPESQLELIKDLYRACAYTADQYIQELIEELEHVDKLDNTIVVVFSDHGDLFGEGGIFGHQYSMAIPLIRVPLLIRDPTGTLSPGRTDRLVQLNDLYPTILELCGISPAPTNSSSLTESESREYAFVHYTSRETDNRNDSELPPGKQYCVCDPDLDQVVWYPETDEYVTDTEEADRLKSALQNHLDNLDRVPPKYAVEVDERTVQNLEELGYM